MQGRSAGCPVLEEKKLKTQINQIVDEVGDEYLVILETALKKNLQGK